MRQFKTLTAGMMTACILLSMLPAWAQNQVLEIPHVDAVYLADLVPIVFMKQRVDESMWQRDVGHFSQSRRLRLF
jgi:hypothetical protein